MFSEYETEKGAWYWAGKCAFQKPSSKELSELLVPKVEIEDKIETTLSSGSIVLKKKKKRTKNRICVFSEWLPAE